MGINAEMYEVGLDDSVLNELGIAGDDDFVWFCLCYIAAIIHIFAQMASPYLPMVLPSSQRDKLKTLPTLSSLKQTFISKADRFVYHYLDNPGPGSYESPMREKHSGDFHVDREEKSPIPKQHQWIISKGRQPFEVKMPCETLTYNEEEATSKKNHSDWGKNKRFNYQKMEKKTHLGPGKYNPESISPKHRSQTLPIKSRASPSAYLNSIIQQTRKNGNQCSELEQQLLQMKIDSIEVARQTPKVVKLSPSPAFKSKCKRLYSERQMNCMIGPGSYDVQTTPTRSKKAVVVRKNQLRTHQRSKSSSLLEDQETMRKGKIAPGPGAYEMTKLQLDTHHKKAVLGLMLKEPRFAKKQKIGLGPGQYMRKRFIHLNINQFQNSNYNPFAKLIQKHPTFGKTQRFQSSSRTPQQVIPFGQYDLGYNDISQKLFRQREHLSKMRQSKGLSPTSPSPAH